jgi:hypothetical protein
MATTTKTETGQRAHRSRQHERKEKERLRTAAAAPSASSSSVPGLAVKGKFANELPLPPVPKLLRALPGCRRFSAYSLSSLDLFDGPSVLGRDLENRLELVDQRAFGELPKLGSMAPPLRPEEQKLVSDYDLGEKVVDAQKKRKRLTEDTEAFHREAFGLQLPQLLTNDVFVERQRFTTGADSTEKKLYRDPPARLDNEGITAQVEKTFTAAMQEPVHPKNPALKARRIMPIVPDATVWANKYRQVVFDELPEKPKKQDLLFMTIPTPRLTCFGYFSSPSEDNRDGNTYRLAQNYVWENRGIYSRQTGNRETVEAESLLLSIPDDGKPGDARFVVVPPWIRLKKQKADTLDLQPAAQILNVAQREPSAQEAQEEHERMGVVMRDEGHETETSDVAWVNGQWVVRSMRAASSKDNASRQGGSSVGQTHSTPPASPAHSSQATPPASPQLEL